MDSVFRNFAEALLQGPDKAALRRLMEDAGLAFDLPHFAYLFAPREAPDRMRLISNYPEDWTSLYMAQGYDRCDPVVRSARLESEPFEWNRDGWRGRLPSPESDLMEEASGFGICCGCTFPIADPASSFAAVTFAADTCGERFRRSVTLHKDVLKLMAYAFHAEARQVLAPRRCICGVTLSPREFECLEWAALGKSAWDTSRIIGVSRRTVTFHLQNAKLKLGVRTVQQAVALLALARRTGR
ncbi:MAG: LuxR family transcriptional regulator [Parvibaculaceae bacterium]